MTVSKEIIKKNSSFYGLQKEAVYQGMELSRINSSCLFNSAISVGGVGHYGTANSLLILAVEESIKGICLTSVYFNVQLPFELGPIFYKHTAKHIQGKDITQYISAVYNMIEFSRILNNKENKVELLKKTIFNFFGRQKIDIATWWDNANEQKNIGFYTDFKNEKFTGPSQFPRKTFLESEKIVRMFVESLSMLREVRPHDYERLQKNPPETD
jgi:AbiV family abortive infection protein